MDVSGERISDWPRGRPRYIASVNNMVACIIRLCRLWSWTRTRSSNGVRAGAAPNGDEDKAATNGEVNVMVTQTGPIQACCTFLLHALSWLIIIFTFPFSVCLCLKVSLHNAETTRQIKYRYVIIRHA